MGLTLAARFVGWVMWSYSVPAIGSILRVCHLKASEVAVLVRLNARGVHEQIASLVKAGWIERGKLVEHPKGEAGFVFILHPSPLSPMEVAKRGRKRQPVSATRPPKARRPLETRLDDLAFARARGKRREQEQARDVRNHRPV